MSGDGTTNEHEVTVDGRTVTCKTCFHASRTYPYETDARTAAARHRTHHDWPYSPRRPDDTK